MNPHELFYFLAFHKLFLRSPRIGRKILSTTGSAELAFRERERFAPYFSRAPVLFDEFKSFKDWSQIESDMKSLEKNKIEAITVSDERYPMLLLFVASAPLILFAKGDVSLLNSPCLGVVGSRKASEHGKNLSFKISEDVALEGITIVSGLAYGIDSCAHKGALASGGSTIGVLGCGHNVVYPSENHLLYEKMFSEGLVVSEFFPDERPHAFNFPQRNRIISGLSLGVLVVEASEKSGSLITAIFALEDGREVFAIPGSGGHPQFAGSNRLIREGAHLVERAEDMLEVLENEARKWNFLKKPRHFAQTSCKGSQLLNFFPAHNEISADTLITNSKLAASKFQSEISSLLIQGLIVETKNGRYRLALKGD